MKFAAWPVRGNLMKSNSPSSDFYQTLSELEREYWHRLDALFQQVQPQQPEKGIEALILRARRQAEAEGISLAEALAQVYAGAAERTRRRVELLSRCNLAE